MLSPEKRDALLTALALHANGGTAKQVAPDVGWKVATTSQRLGWLYFMGALDRVEITALHREYHYRIKPPKTEAPPVQWQPEVRIAGRAIRNRERVLKKVMAGL